MAPSGSVLPAVIRLVAFAPYLMRPRCSLATLHRMRVAFEGCRDSSRGGRTNMHPTVHARSSLQVRDTRAHGRQIIMDGRAAS